MQALLSCEVQEQAVKRMASTVSKHFLELWLPLPPLGLKKSGWNAPASPAGGNSEGVLQLH